MAHTPDLVQVHDSYRDRDVRFFALTSESSFDLKKIDAFAAQLSIPWPIGYEAGETIRDLGVSGIPTTFVVGRDGYIAWNSFQMGSLENAIDEAL